ncbi:DUF72 domain-containing protein [Raineya orbicola]|uniref:DUF72 domain-containing protein n=1 Tax=Raineya orbicola TaxID=2016530 RepID=UPI001FAF4349|nr:DUF72 domain-containing protein [Raineya orbicola]
MKVSYFWHMDFGKLQDISRVDFRLPASKQANEAVLSKFPSQTLQVWVGLPVWSQKEWVGKIYPPKAQSKDFLKYYAEQFNSIELNTTHYRIPDKATIELWKKQVNKDFHFCPKFPQPISHEKMLQNCQNLVTEFCEAISGLEENLGLSFLQLPPYFELKHLPILENFLAEFPVDIPLAVEFRHASWFKEENFEKAAQVLERYNKSTVITDVAGRRDVLHQRITNSALMVRFVGNGLHPTDYSRLDEWIWQIGEWQKQGLQRIYFFLHEPDNILAPEIALYFIEKLNLTCKTNLLLPKFFDKNIQMKLF